MGVEYEDPFYQTSIDIPKFDKIGSAMRGLKIGPAKCGLRICPQTESMLSSLTLTL